MATAYRIVNAPAPPTAYAAHPSASVVRGSNRGDSFDVVVYVGTFSILIAAIWLMWPGWVTALGRDAVIADLLVHAWIGDVDMIDRFLVLEDALEPGRLAYLLLGALVAVAGPELAAVIAALAWLFAAAGACLAISLGGERAGWSFSVAALALMSGAALHVFPASSLLGLACALGAIAHWLARTETQNLVGGLALAVLVLLTTLAYPPLLLPLAVALLALAGGEGLVALTRYGARDALSGVWRHLLVIALAIVPAGIVLAFHSQRDAINLASLLPNGFGTESGASLIGAVSSLGGFEVSVVWLLVGLTVAALVYGLLRRASRGALAQRDGVVFAALALFGLLPFLGGAPFEAADTRLMRHVVLVFAISLAISWAAMDLRHKVVRHGLLGLVVVAATALVGYRATVYDDLRAAKATLATVAAVVEADEAAIVIAPGGPVGGIDPALARLAAHAVLADAGAVVLSDPLLALDPVERFGTANPPLRLRRSQLPQARAGGPDVRYVLVVGTTAGDGPLIGDRYSPAFAHPGGLPITLYERAGATGSAGDGDAGAEDGSLPDRLSPRSNSPAISVTPPTAGAAGGWIAR